MLLIFFRPKSAVWQHTKLLKTKWLASFVAPRPSWTCCPSHHQNRSRLQTILCQSWYSLSSWQTRLVFCPPFNTSIHSTGTGFAGRSSTGGCSSLQPSSSSRPWTIKINNDDKQKIVLPEMKCLFVTLKKVLSIFIGSSYVVLLCYQHKFSGLVILHFWSKYSGDLNSGNIWITNFHLFAIQMPANSSLIKPSVTQPISHTTYDLKSGLLVSYSSHVLNDKLLVRYSSHDLNKDHSRSKLFWTIWIPN